MINPANVERLRRLSEGLTGNNVVLAVAAAMVTIEPREATSAPRIGEELGGKVPTNRIGEALLRLSRLGALSQLPYPGPPHPRLYEVVEGPFWTFVSEWALDPQVDLVDR